VGTKVENISIFLNQGSFGNIGRTLRDVGKEKIVFKIIKNIKKHIMCARNINVLVGEKLNIIFKINGTGKISCTKLSI
jgi:hypothetical protein